MATKKVSKAVKPVLTNNKAKSKPVTSLKNEVWKPLKNSDRKYLISNMGRLIGFYFDKENGKLVKGKTVNGYLAVDIVFNNERKMRYVHTLVAEHFVKRKSPKASIVIHNNWNKLDNKASNLEWSLPATVVNRTAERNKQYAARMGTVSAKLNREQVSKIKKQLKAGNLQFKIAENFGVSEMQISRIARGLCWANVK
ncbi:MAG: HNH endonuclease [Bacteroidia bacterium]|nr:HNH endonuclease [Bacteroidia bacterium]HQV00288.1 NUMOD4 domain-containing protein [Bacteroidia bacterium]